MASYLDKTHINTAVSDNSKQDLGHQHVTTGDFMQLNVSTIEEKVPGQKLDVKMETFARLNPLPVPTFGRANLNNRGFFVPFRTIFRGWNDFIVDAVHVASDGYPNVSWSSALLSSTPTVEMSVLCDAFRNYIGLNAADQVNMIYQQNPDSTFSNVDLSITSGGTTRYYCYTTLGRQCLKNLEALGYKLDYSDLFAKQSFSALPLLALARIFCDWYFPQAYADIVEYDTLSCMFNYDVHSGPINLSASDVYLILKTCSFVQYDSDLFVSAWDVPNQPNVHNNSDFKLVNIDTATTVFGSAVSYPSQNGQVTNYSGTADSTYRVGGNAPFISPYVATAASSVATPISEYLLHGLHALTDYLKRHQLAGSRAFDRYLARFGKALPAEKLGRCVYLGNCSQSIQIGDVMSTSDTIDPQNLSGSQLGSFAGKGISYGSGNFSYETDEFGYFIVLSSIVPATMYFQGIDPLVMRQNKLDFWTPEFENLGVEPIRAANLFIPQMPGTMSQGNPFDQVFGFVPRYASYKCPTCMDRVTGNFRVPSLNNGPFVNSGNSWHLARVFKPGDFSGNYANIVHGVGFVMSGDRLQYKRLFYDDDSASPDNFTIIHNFEEVDYAPMKPLYDVYEFEDKGKQVTLDVNGVKLN